MPEGEKNALLEDVANYVKKFDKENETQLFDAMLREGFKIKNQ